MIIFCIATLRGAGCNQPASRSAMQKKSLKTFSVNKKDGAVSEQRKVFFLCSVGVSFFIFNFSLPLLGRGWGGKFSGRVFCPILFSAGVRGRPKTKMPDTNPPFLFSFGGYGTAPTFPKKPNGGTLRFHISRENFSLKTFPHFNFARCFFSLKYFPKSFYFSPKNKPPLCGD